MKKALFACGFLLTVLLAPGNCPGFRCGDELVSIGDTKGRVLIQCGPPTHKETTSVKSRERDASYEAGSTLQGKTKVATRKTKTERVERWYYNCGANDFIYVLTFEGGILTAEDTEGHGRGKSDCGGRTR